MNQPLYSHLPDGYLCPFCHITLNRTSPFSYSQPEDIVFQDDLVTALVASHQYPRNAPNILVMPNAHYENIFDLPPALGADIFRVAQKVAFALKREYGCDGISTRQHNEPAGSQEVWHYHLHVTPRFANDRFYDSIYKREFMPAAQRGEHAARLRAHLPIP